MGTPRFATSAGRQTGHRGLWRPLPDRLGAQVRCCGSSTPGKRAHLQTDPLLLRGRCGPVRLLSYLELQERPSSVGASLGFRFSIV